MQRGRDRKLQQLKRTPAHSGKCYSGREEHISGPLEWKNICLRHFDCWTRDKTWSSAHWKEKSNNKKKKLQFLSNSPASFSQVLIFNTNQIMTGNSQRQFYVLISEHTFIPFHSSQNNALNTHPPVLFKRKTYCLVVKCVGLEIFLLSSFHQTLMSYTINFNSDFPFFFSLPGFPVDIWQAEMQITGRNSPS